jgi:HEAT repeat protein
MAHDDAPEVRRIIAERMSPEDAVALLTDPDWVVRYTAVQRVAPEALINLLDDPEPDVRAAVQERLISHANQAHGNKKPEA